ncbi:tetratricopeptide repeat protein [Streptomyces poriticola]|uniref:tetratricopeptide repeat protein n=1 Tax=Streptomyces poriticola TaxID=3120506 RepID=UPI002FCE2E5C
MNLLDDPVRRRRARRTRRVLIASGALIAVLGVLGGVLVLRPWERGFAPAAAGPAARARGALTAGAPAAPADLAVLIGGHEAHLRERPGDAAAWAVLGAAYVERGRRTADAADFPRAERALRASLKADRGNAAALEGLAALAVARRDFPAAKRWGEAARKAAPKRWTAHAVLIDAYSGLGEHEAVGRALDRLQKLGSGPVVGARAAQVYRDRGWREDAAAQISDALAAAEAPAERAAYLEQAGQLAFERGDREAALRYFRAAVRADPDRRGALAGQGRVLVALDRTAEALTAYQAALAGRPRPEHALELGELYESLGLGRSARVQYDLLRERVRKADAGGVGEELVLGRFEADHGDARAAVQRLRAEWRRQPGTAVADALGWALHRAGRHEEALRYAVRATEGEHGGGVRSALYVFHRGVIERKLQRYGAARRHLREALRINPYFSPLWVPQAERALERLGEPSVEDPPAS